MYENMVTVTVCINTVMKYRFYTDIYTAADAILEIVHCLNIEHIKLDLCLPVVSHV